MVFSFLKRIFVILVVGLSLMGAQAQTSHAVEGSSKKALLLTAIPFIPPAATIAAASVEVTEIVAIPLATIAGTGLSTTYVTLGEDRRELVNAVIQDAGAFIASDGELKSALLSALIATLREMNPKETSSLTDEDLVIDLLSSQE